MMSPMSSARSAARGAAVAVGGAEAGDVEAGERVGVRPRGADLGPGRRVQLLPRHLPRRLGRAEVPRGRLLRGSHEREPALLRYLPQQRRPLLPARGHCSIGRSLPLRN